MSFFELVAVRFTQAALAVTATAAVYAALKIESCYRNDLPPRTDWSQE